jgi:hypothetical protein
MEAHTQCDEMIAYSAHESEIDRALTQLSSMRASPEEKREAEQYVKNTIIPLLGRTVACSKEILNIILKKISLKISEGKSDSSVLSHLYKRLHAYAKETHGMMDVVNKTRKRRHNNISQGIKVSGGRRKATRKCKQKRAVKKVAKAKSFKASCKRSATILKKTRSRR